MCHLCGLRLAKRNNVMLSHHAQVKVTKSKYNLQFLNVKLIVEGILRCFSNKSAFDDKLNLSYPAGVVNYLICMHCFETNTCAPFR